MSGVVDGGQSSLGVLCHCLGKPVYSWDRSKSVSWCRSGHQQVKVSPVVVMGRVLTWELSLTTHQVVWGPIRGLT